MLTFRPCSQKKWISTIPFNGGYDGLTVMDRVGYVCGYDGLTVMDRGDMFADTMDLL